MNATHVCERMKDWFSISLSFAAICSSICQHVLSFRNFHKTFSEGVSTRNFSREQNIKPFRSVNQEMFTISHKTLIDQVIKALLIPRAFTFTTPSDSLSNKIWEILRDSSIPEPTTVKLRCKKRCWQGRHKRRSKKLILFFFLAVLAPKLPPCFPFPWRAFCVNALTSPSEKWISLIKNDIANLWLFILN